MKKEIKVNLTLKERNSLGRLCMERSVYYMVCGIKPMAEELDTIYAKLGMQMCGFKTITIELSQPELRALIRETMYKCTHCQLNNEPDKGIFMYDLNKKLNKVYRDAQILS